MLKKRRSQMFTCAIVRVTARCLKGTYLVKGMRIECVHSNSTNSYTCRSWDPKLACECSDIRAVQGQRLLCAYRNAPSSEHLGEQSSMRLIANTRI